MNFALRMQASMNIHVIAGWHPKTYRARRQPWLMLSMAGRADAWLEPALSMVPMQSHDAKPCGGAPLGSCLGRRPQLWQLRSMNAT